VFGYDEEGRLTKIARDHGGGELHLAYEYGYNSDAARVWQREITAVAVCRWRMSTGTIAMVRVCGSGMC